MECIVASSGTSGDIFPFLALAGALQARGHRVRCLGSPNMASHAAQLGVPFQSFISDADYHRCLQDSAIWDADHGFYALWRHVWPALAQLPAQLDQLATQARPALLVCHPLLAPLLQLWRERQPPGIRLASLVLAPSNLRTVYDPLLLGPHKIPSWMPLSWRRWLWAAGEKRTHWPQMLADLNQRRQQDGLPPVANLIDHFSAAPDLLLGLFPDWFAARAPDWPAHFVHAGFPRYQPATQAALSAELQTFLQAGPAPLVFTPGTGYANPRQYFATALQALQQSGQRAVFLSSYAEQLPPLPPQVLWQAFAPLASLLPHCAALVHHGGIGSCAEALAAGVPQLIIPSAYDQFDNAARLERLGVGCSLHMRRLKPRRLQAKLAQLPALRSNCATVQQMCSAQPGSAVLQACVQHLEAGIVGVD